MNPLPLICLRPCHQGFATVFSSLSLTAHSAHSALPPRILEADDQDMLEEERRLFYVALTRAKDELYLSYPMMNPKSYSGDIICRPSQFLDDFPQDLVEEWNVGNDNPWSDDEPF
jgi:superfamily I DNA/RNA helicase